MKTKWPTIRRRVYPSGLASFQVDLGELNGKRERHTFGTKEEAESFAEQARVKRLNEGLSAFAISQELRVDALNASGLLQGRDVSLTGCAEYYLKHAAAYQNAPKIPAIVARMLTEAESNQRRGRTVEDLRARLNTFAEDFKEHRLGNLTVEDIQEWVIDDDWQPRTRINYLTKISQLMNFGIRNGWIETNIAERIPRPSVEDAEPKIFTVEQAQILLDNAHAHNLLPYVAISLFGGLRSAELLRLDWPSVIVEQDVIRVGANVAKKRARRFAAINDTLKAWLNVHAWPKQGAVVDASKFRQSLENLRKAVGIQEWPHNGLRHSFGSYHFAMYGDAIKTAQRMGNSADIVHRHYKALVLPADAARFWQLRPKEVSQPDSLRLTVK